MNAFSMGSSDDDEEGSTKRSSKHGMSDGDDAPRANGKKTGLKRKLSLTSHREDAATEADGSDAESEPESKKKGKGKGKSRARASDGGGGGGAAAAPKSPKKKKGKAKMPPNWVDKATLKPRAVLTLALNMQWQIKRMPLEKKYIELKNPTLPDESNKASQSKFWDQFHEAVRNGVMEGDGMPYLYVLTKLDAKKDPTDDDERSAFYVNGCMLLAPKGFVCQKWAPTSRMINDRLNALAAQADETRTQLSELKKAGDEVTQQQRSDFRQAATQFLNNISVKNKPRKMSGVTAPVTWPPEVLDERQTKLRKTIDGTVHYLRDMYHRHGADEEDDDAVDALKALLAEYGGLQLGAGGLDTDGGAAAVTTPKKKKSAYSLPLEEACEVGKSLPPSKTLGKAAAAMKRVIEHRMRAWIQQHTIKVMQEEDGVKLDDDLVKTDADGDGLYYKGLTMPWIKGSLGVQETDLSKLPDAMPEFGELLGNLGIDAGAFYLLAALLQGGWVEYAMRHQYFKEHPPAKKEKKSRSKKSQAEEKEDGGGGEEETTPAPRKKKPAVSTDDIAKDLEAEMETDDVKEVPKPPPKSPQRAKAKPSAAVAAAAASTDEAEAESDKTERKIIHASRKKKAPTTTKLDDAVSRDDQPQQAPTQEDEEEGDDDAEPVVIEHPPSPKRQKLDKAEKPSPQPNGKAKHDPVFAEYRAEYKRRNPDAVDVVEQTPAEQEAGESLFASAMAQSESLPSSPRTSPMRKPHPSPKKSPVKPHVNGIDHSTAAAFVTPPRKTTSASAVAHATAAPPPRVTRRAPITTDDDELDSILS